MVCSSLQVTSKPSSARRQRGARPRAALLAFLPFEFLEGLGFFGFFFGELLARCFFGGAVAFRGGARFLRFLLRLGARLLLCCAGLVFSGALLGLLWFVFGCFGRLLRCFFLLLGFRLRRGFSGGFPLLGLCFAGFFAAARSGFFRFCTRFRTLGFATVTGRV